MMIRRYAVPAALVCLLLIGATAGGCTGNGSLHVLVMAEDGTPLAGAKVISNTQPQGQMKVTGGTDSEGEVTYSDIAAGEYEFYVSRFDYENQVFQVKVKAGRTTDVTVTLEKTG